MKRFAYVLTMLAVVAGVSAATIVRAAAPPAAKLRVAVFKFDDKTDHSYHWYGGKTAGEGLADMLTTALVKSGRYRVFERKEIETVMSEQRLGASGNVTQETAAKAGKLLGAQYAVIGVITEFGYKQRSTGGWLKKAGVSGGVSQTTAVLAVDVRFVDTETGEVIKAETVTRQKSAMGVHANTEDFAGGSESKFDDSLVGKAARDAVDSVVDLLTGQTGGASWSAKIVSVGDGTCIINAGGENAKAGKRYLIFRAGEELKDPDTGESLGSKEEQVGEIEITGAFGSTGRASNCKIVSGTLQAGDIVREKK
jgi:curli biogenesis system outer membrane secretion channel CsgG